MISTRFCPVCGAANELARTHCFACGEMLSASSGSVEAENEALLHERYQLGMLLGTGGFSQVFYARDRQAHGRKVAIKQINLQGLSAEETIDATDTFNREVNLLAQLHHPQIPQLYEHFHDRDHWYLVLEYLEGTTLEVYLEQQAAQGQTIQLEEAVTMALQLCVVLEYLHTRQPAVIFRDLKPGNIIRTPGGKLCLIDFGIARRYRPGQRRDTQRLGSPGYAAPEQYGRAQTTPQADIYSLGALLHRLLSGQDPSTQPHGLVPLRLSGQAYETELAELVQRMLAPNPAERPARIGEVESVLLEIKLRLQASHEIGRIWIPPTPQTQFTTSYGQQQLQMIHTPAQPQSTPPTAKRRTNRRNVLIGLGTLAVALAGGQVAWQVLQRSPGPFPGPRSANAGNALFTYQGHSDAVWNAVWSANSLRIVSCAYDQTAQIWDALSGNNVFIYQGHTGAVNDAAWSPDSRRVATASADHTVQIWNAADGSNALIYRGHSATVQEANWSPDGSRIASCSIDKTVQVWDAQDGSLLGIYRGHSEEVLAAKWSPDGTHIASSSGDATVQIWNAASLHRRLTYHGHTGAVNEVSWSPAGSLIASASDDGTVQIWNAQNGNNVRTYTGHTQTVNDAAWSPDGSMIASASDDGTVQIWNASDGTLIFTYTGHTQPVIAASWSPDGAWLASASTDTTVQIWQAP